MDAPPLRRAHVLTLHVDLRCDSACAFCGARVFAGDGHRLMSSHAAAVPDLPVEAARRYTLEEALDEVRDACARGVDVLTLQGGEPTLWPPLVALVRAARDLGFVEITLTTNGRRLADARLARALVDAGLTHVSLSWLGATRDTHDGLARVQGAFDELIEGSRAMVDAARAHEARTGRHVFVTANYVLCAPNVAELAMAVTALATSGIESVLVHPIRLEGEAARHVAALVPRLDALRTHLPEAVRAARRCGLRLHLPGLPPCLFDDPFDADADEEGTRERNARHETRGPALGYVIDHARRFSDPPTCAACLFATTCRRLPPEYVGAGAPVPVRPAAIANALREAKPGIEQLRWLRAAEARDLTEDDRRSIAALARDLASALLDEAAALAREAPIEAARRVYEACGLHAPSQPAPGSRRSWADAVAAWRRARAEGAPPLWRGGLVVVHRGPSGCALALAIDEASSDRARRWALAVLSSACEGAVTAEPSGDALRWRFADGREDVWAAIQPER